MKARRIKHEIEHFSKLEHIWWGAKTPAGQRRYDNRLELFKKMCRSRKQGLILEIGCGDGEFTKRLTQLPSDIVGCDVTPQVIKRAKNQFPRIKYQNVSFKVNNAENMSFEDNTFDVVCGISILHHIDIKKVLEECHRVLKRGGVIFFSEPNLLNPHIWLGLNIPFLRKRMEYSPDETALVRWKIEKILDQIGFSQTSVSNYDFLYPLTPAFLIPWVERLGIFLEKLPLVKEISGSLIIYARK